MQEAQVSCDKIQLCSCALKQSHIGKKKRNARVCLHWYGRDFFFDKQLWNVTMSSSGYNFKWIA